MRQYLVDLRVQHGLSQQDVANRLGISRQYYQMIENGERQKHLALSLASSFAVLYALVSWTLSARRWNWPKKKPSLILPPDLSHSLDCKGDL